MARRCEICSHPGKLEMERAYIKGISISQIAREHGVGEESVRYHMANHLSRQLVQAYRKKEEIQGLDLLGDINELITRTKSILDTVEKKKQYGLALGAIREVRGSYELLARIAALLHATQKEELEEQAKQEKVQLQEQFDKKLKILSPGETELYRKLNLKILSQNSKMKVLPDKSFDLNNAGVTNDHNPSDIKMPRRTKSPAKRRKTGSNEEVEADQVPDHQQVVNPGPYIEQIPVTPWSENPDNPKYLLSEERKLWNGGKG